MKRTEVLDRMKVRPKAPAPSWKPKHCATCRSKWPGFNIDGNKAGSPWYCGLCVKTALPMPCEDMTLPAARPAPALLL